MEISLSSKLTFFSHSYAYLWEGKLKKVKKKSAQYTHLVNDWHEKCSSDIDDMETEY